VEGLLERRQSAEVGGSNLKDGPAAEAEARAEAEAEGSARGGRQSGLQQSGRKVKLKGRSRSASGAAEQEGRAGWSVTAQADDVTEGEAERLVERREPIERQEGRSGGTAGGAS